MCAAAWRKILPAGMRAWRPSRPCMADACACSRQAGSSATSGVAAQDVKLMMMADYGPKQLYGNAMMVNTDYAKASLQVVRRFAAAAVKGVLADLEAVIVSVMERNETADEALVPKSRNSHLSPVSLPLSATVAVPSARCRNRRAHPEIRRAGQARRHRALPACRRPGRTRPRRHRR